MMQDFMLLRRVVSEAEERIAVANQRREANGDDALVYGGKGDLIHVPNGERSTYGERAADYIEAMMRSGAEDRSDEDRATQPLCPGCYMVVIFNTALALAHRSGQSYRELGKSLAAAFTSLAQSDGEPGLIEEICVILDREEEDNA